MSASQQDFDAAAAAHRDAVSAYVDTAVRIPSDAWNAPYHEGKWSPAQVTEHLRLSYSTVRAELAGHGGFRVRTAWWQQRLFQLIYLPRILRKGRMPRGVPAVREIRPGDGPFDQQSLIEALRMESENFLGDLDQVRADSARTVSHPFLGKLTLLEGLGLATQHLRHHHRQLEERPR